MAERKFLPRAPSGIRGLDEITGGGLPAGRPTLVCGGSGCGKTLLAMEFLVRGALQHGEPGVFMAFEETPTELSENVMSLGFDLEGLMRAERLVVDHVHIDRSEIEETGEYDLEGLFIRLGLAIDSVGAKRVVLDTLEALFGGFSNEAILRSELRRLFRWLKDKGVTAVITAERGDGTFTRHGLEAYVSDCVILLDHRVDEQRSTRRMRIVKFRGALHGTNEYPFLIDEDGISVLPVTSAGLAHDVSDERITTGVPRLDEMLGGGVYRGSSILVSGTAGTGKTSLAAHFADACCGNGERCVYFSFEESAAQIVRNMRSIGLDLQRWIERGLLQVISARASAYGLELHLATIHKTIQALRPQLVIVDPISSFLGEGSALEANAMVLRLLDSLKAEGVTGLFTTLTRGDQALELSSINVSSLVDTWMLLRDIEFGGERNRGIYILKSRGMAHSNQIREFLLSSNGIELKDVYVGSEGVLTGSMRMAQEARERASAEERRQEIVRRRRDLLLRRETLENQIASQRAQFQTEEEELERLLTHEQAALDLILQDRRDMVRSRQSHASPGPLRDAGAPSHSRGASDGA